MILFQDDWRREGAIIHENTTNKSFVRIAMVLKTMGISNHVFPLALLQPDLAQYDPHNLRDPSFELRGRIALECKLNPWYLFREVLRIPASGSSAIPFDANRANIAMIWCFYNNISYIAIQPRQTGKAQPLDARVQTPAGGTQMGDLKIGDPLTAADGAPTIVTGVYPQGMKDIFRVVLEDGRSTECCDEHLWKVYSAGRDQGYIADLNTLRQSNHDLYIPIADPQLLPRPGRGLQKRKVHSISYVGRKPAQCIEIAHPEHLYITDDHIVTHNTVTACSLLASVMYISGLNMRMSLYTKDVTLIQENVVRIKIIRDALPAYMIHKQVSDTDNKEGLSYSRFHNEYLTKVAQSSPQSADNAGRGMTAPVIHIDEPGFCDNIQITYPVMMLSTIEAVKNAANAGQPHSNILTTTAAPLDTIRGRYTYDLVCGAMPMTETLYDLTDKAEAQAVVRANSANGMINGTYSYLQLGRDRKWLEDAIRAGNLTKEVTDRELLNIWTASGADALLDPMTIDLLNKNIHDPIWHEMLGDYVLKWYIDEATVKSPTFARRKLVLAMDSSENIGEDFTTLVMIDAADMSVLAVFRCNATNTIKLGMFIADLLLLYRNITFIPERNSTGGAIIDTIVLTFRNHGINPFRRIYNQVVQDRKLESMKDIDLDDPDVTETSVKKYLGFRTTTKTRPFLYKNTLKKAVGLNVQRIHDRSLITELSALSVVNGRIDHSEGQHDDTVIAYLLACWLLFYGENLSYYGITANDILTRVAADGSAVDAAHRDHQLGIRRMIKFYQDLVDVANSPVIRSNYLQKILSLKSQLDPNLNLEPIGVTKVHQDVQDYGHTHYTPQAIAARTQIAQRTTQALDMLRSFAF